MTSASLTRMAPSALSDRQMYRLLLAVTFPVFLVAVTARRLVGDTSRPARSLLAEARDMGSSTLHVAFMG